MRPKVSDMLLFALSFIFCAGCSVKENRDICPCRLVLYFSEVDTASVKSIDVFIRADDEVILNENIGMENFSEDYMAYVPRTWLGLSAWSGGGDTFDGKVVIPHGQECPPVYIHSSTLDAKKESLEETIMMRKNFCRMTLNVRMTIESPVGLAILGNVDGYGYDGKPSSGDFLVRVDPEGDNVFCVNLPRQMDNSLFMEVDTGDDVVKKFPLGQYIAESGYDWCAPDLADLTIDLDFALTHISMMIQGWEKEYRFDVVI